MAQAKQVEEELERRRAELAGPRKRILHKVEIGLDEYVLLSKPTVDIERETYDGSTPVLSAIARGHDRVVQVLLDPGRVSLTRVAANGETPLNIAAKHGRYELAHLLLSRDAIGRDAALLTAVGEGDVRMVG